MEDRKNTYLSYILATLMAAFIALLTNAQAAVTISCSHPELCKLSQLIFTENQIEDYEFKTLVKIVGDPHEYEPQVLEIKNLIQADILVTGPAELNPWIKKVNYQRSKNTKFKTITLPLNKEDIALYGQAANSPSSEALSHFWLYPKVFCSLKSKLEDQFFSLKIIPVMPAKKICTLEAHKVETELMSSLNAVKIPIVLTHDALLPLLSFLTNHGARIVAIKGSGHHQETTPQSVKKLYDALALPKVIWIEEAGIRVPQNVLAKKRSGDITIRIDTANSHGLTYFPVLLELSEKLKAIKP